MKILYFAWLRERLNKGEETVSLPQDVKTISDLLDWLAQRDEAAALALGDKSLIRAALDEQIVDPDTPLAGAQTVALFPPMTGG